MFFNRCKSCGICRPVGGGGAGCELRAAAGGREEHPEERCLSAHESDTADTGHQTGLRKTTVGE